MFWRKLDKRYFLYVGGQFSHFFTFCVPDMNCAVLAAREDEEGVGAEGALDDGGLIHKIGEFVQLVALKSIKENNAVVSCGQHQ